MKRQRKAKTSGPVKPVVDMGQTFVLDGSTSSNYSTCSDNFAEKNEIWDSKNLHDTMQSTIVAGHLPDTCNDTNLLEITEANENYTIGILDKTIEIEFSDSDHYLDCENSTLDLKLDDESTTYRPLEIANTAAIDDNLFSSMDPSGQNLSTSKSNVSTSNLLVNKNFLNNSSNDAKDDTDVSKNYHGRLLTILEETELTHMTNQLLNISSRKNSLGNAKDVSFTVPQYKVNKLSSSDSSKGVKNRNKKTEKIVNSASEKDKVYRKKTDENCNIHNNDTQSFVYWEQFCQITNASVLRRSLSCSNLSSFIYEADNEFSTTFSESNASRDSTNLSLKKIDLQKLRNSKKIPRKSRSCESLLTEIKHLPHILYDRCLDFLGNEIKKIRQQGVICSCIKEPELLTKSLNSREDKKQPSKLKSFAENTVENTAPHKQRSFLSNFSQKSGNNKTSNLSQNQHSKSNQYLAPKKPFYSWEKEIVSPVKEYIQGKRPSPFKKI